MTFYCNFAIIFHGIPRNWGWTMKTAFIGHRQIFANDINERLLTAIEIEIKNGCKSFIMGTHGQFDMFALCACRRLRGKYKDLDIEVVLTSLHAIDKNEAWDSIPYSDVKTVMYDIEDIHFKRQITLSNRLMINDCDRLICYVNEKAYRSGAKTAMNYAKRNGLKIVNLWHEHDDPFYGMTKEQAQEYLQDMLDKFLQND